MASPVRIGAILIIAAGLFPAARAAAPNPDAEVPRGSWAYDAVTLLAKYGVATGRPDGHFKGRRPVMRSDFAETIGFILGDAKRLEGEGSLWPSHRRKPEMERLITEFRPELAAMGATAADLRSGVERFQRIWRNPRPKGVTEPLPGSQSRWRVRRWPDDLPARQEGYRDAQAEWERGEIVLYSIPEEHPIQLKAKLTRAIPLKPLEDSENPRAIQKALGHNAAMWKWLREKGPPSGRLSWLRQVFELEKLAAGQRPAGLLNGGSLSPEGAVLVEHQLAPEASYLAANGRYLPFEFLYTPFGGYGASDFQWAEAGTGVARIDVAFKAGKRIYAVDCRTGCVLNAK